MSCIEDIEIAVWALSTLLSAGCANILQSLRRVASFHAAPIIFDTIFKISLFNMSGVERAPLLEIIRLLFSRHAMPFISL